jgi:hypothetical protein
MVSYSNVEIMLEGYKIKSALPYKIFLSLEMMVKSGLDFLSISKFFVPFQSCYWSNQPFWQIFYSHHKIRTDKNFSSCNKTDVFFSAACCKKDTIFGAARKNFGLSYFVTALARGTCHHFIFAKW